MKKSKYTEIITEASTSEKAPAGAAAEPAPGCASCAPRVTTAEEARANAAEASAAARAAAEACPYHIGIDVGSTTVKLAVLDNDHNILWAVYRRHHADVRATIIEVLREAAEAYPAEAMTIAITGSGGLLLSQWLGVAFVQEVIASKTAVETFIPATDVAIELGGEDAKIIYFDHGIEQRMNGTCAGGTGAFIDQMAALLNTDAGGLNELAADHSTIYPIASRCGVFAKTDVQPLLNEGARREDIAASIFQSVVTQTISGLACGRPIRGNVAFLGGPLQYLSELRKRFYETLELTDEAIIVPENAHLFVAAGCAIAGVGEGAAPRSSRMCSCAWKGSATCRAPKWCAWPRCSPTTRSWRSFAPATMASACAARRLRTTAAWPSSASMPAPPPSRRRSSARTGRCSGPPTPPTKATCSGAPRPLWPSCTRRCPAILPRVTRS